MYIFIQYIYSFFLWRSDRLPSFFGVPAQHAFFLRTEHGWVERMAANTWYKTTNLPSSANDVKAWAEFGVDPLPLFQFDPAAFRNKSQRAAAFNDAKLVYTLVWGSDFHFNVGDNPIAQSKAANSTLMARIMGRWGGEASKRTRPRTALNSRSRATVNCHAPPVTAVL